MSDGRSPSVVPPPVRTVDPRPPVRTGPPSPRHPRVVVGVDGSDSAQRALRWAIGEAAIRGASLEMVQVWKPRKGASPPPPPKTPDVNSDAIEVSSRVVKGDPACVLLAVAADADLLVIGTRGLGGVEGILLGSVSQHVAGHSRVPVVAVPDGAPLPSERRPVVVAVDRSDGAAKALRFAADHAARWHVPLKVVHAWDTPYPAALGGVAVVPRDPAIILERSRHLLVELWSDTRGRLERVPANVELHPAACLPAETLLNRARDAGLLVVGSRGRSRAAGVVLGSVSQRCLHSAPCAVAVVPGR